MANIKLAIVELHKAFNQFNECLFNNNIPEPAILIQNQGNRKNILGWCTQKEIWNDEEEQKNKYEINICAEYLNRNVDEILETLLHEMVHLNNIVQGIKDTSRSGSYHNKNYKEQAEKYGLEVEFDNKSGWCITSLQDKTKQLISEFGIDNNAFRMVRQFEQRSGGEKNSSIRKYVCTECEVSVKATKEVNIVCGDCEVKMLCCS